MAADSLKKMARICAGFQKDDNCYIFWEPVDWKAMHLLDYPKIIKHPMDLSTIASRLEKGSYSNAAECAKDFRLMWENCKTYNRNDDRTYNLAVRMSKKFEERYSKVAEAEAAAAGGGGGAAASQEPSGPRLPTLADKTQFGHGLYVIGREELGSVIMRLDQCCPQAIERAGPCDVEVNVDAIDPATFWDLLAMVTGMTPQPQSADSEGTRKAKRRSDGGGSGGSGGRASAAKKHRS